MSQLTKKTILEATLKLAEKKSFTRIKVRDIVEACGITRNTFYYYYRDIYEVIEDFLDSSFAALEEKVQISEEEATQSFIELCVRYKKVLTNLYTAIGHERVAREITKRIRPVIMQMIDEACGDKQIEVKDKELICSFYEEMIFGTAVRWLRNDRDRGSKESIEDTIRRISRLFRGHLEFLIKNAQN